jgi:hypothetical protein
MDSKRPVKTIWRVSTATCEAGDSVIHSATLRAGSNRRYRERREERPTPNVQRRTFNKGKRRGTGMKGSRLESNARLGRWRGHSATLRAGSNRHDRVALKNRKAATNRSWRLSVY